jgi:hypothetical protein
MPDKRINGASRAVAELGARQNDTRDYFVPDRSTKSVIFVKAKHFRE